MLCRRVILPLLVSAFIFPAFAPVTRAREMPPAEDDARTHELGTVVVTGTPLDSEVEDVPFHVTVIERAEIEKTGARTLADVLSGLPGVFVHRTGDFGRTDPVIRGLGERGRETVILVDGIPVKAGHFNCSVTHAHPIANIERIEVARGPNSVLYGSDALGGVINIITRRAEAEGQWTDLTFSGGSHGTLQGLFAHGGKSGQFDYFLSSDLIRSDGHRPDSAYRSADHSLKLGYSLAPDLSLSFFGKYFRGRKNEPGPPGTQQPDNNLEDYERTFSSLSLAGKNPGSEFSASLSHNYGHHDLRGTPYRDNIYRAEAAYTTFAIADNELTFGGEWKWSEGRELGKPENWQRYDYGAYFWNRRHWNDFSLLFGARYQRDSVAGDFLAPQGGFIYRFGGGGRLRGQFARAFRYPAINDLFMFPPSNENLKPEKVDGYELGVEKNFAGNFSASVNFFLVEGKDRIEGFPFRNTGEFRHRGIETGLGMKRAGNALDLNHTWLDPGDDTSGRPGSKLDFGWRYSGTGYSLAAGIQHVSRYYAGDGKSEPLPSFMVVNARVSREFGRHLEGFIGVDNLFGEDYGIYDDLPGLAAGVYPMPGRTFRVGFSGRF